MSSLRTWYSGRSLREQRLILIMLALAVATLIWAGLVIPVRDALSDSRSRHRDAAERLGQTLLVADAVRRERRAGVVALDRPLADAVRQRAEAAGFALASLEPDGADRVRASLTSARPSALFAWLASMEAAGILVEASAITPNADRTLAAQLTLAARRP